MSTNFFRVQNFGVQKLNPSLIAKVKSAATEEEQPKTEKTETATTGTETTVKNEVKTGGNQKFDQWLSSEYSSTFYGLNGVSTSSTLTEKDVKNWEALQKAIKSMGLRATNCKGVYCEQHNPNRPAGDYSHQRHYVWNDSTQKMEEIPNVYYISKNGYEAKGLAAYEKIEAYRQGFQFTETDGVYAKDGKTYKFNAETLKFEEYTKTALESLWEKYETDENDTYVPISKLVSFIEELHDVVINECGYTEEQFQDLVQKAIKYCDVKKPPLPGPILVAVNLKEFVTTVRELMEGTYQPKEPTNPLDKVLDKYTADEYDENITLQEAIPIFEEMMNELIPVLKEEYNISRNEAMKILLGAVEGTAISQRGNNTILVNIKMIAEAIKEAVENYKPEEKGDINKILDQYDTDEYNAIIKARDAISTIMTIISDITPVLEKEYGLNSSEINAIFTEAIQNCTIKNVYTNDSYICIRDFANTLREIINDKYPKLIQEPLPVLYEYLNNKLSA